ncbi:hypothetical protein R6Q57_010571 [Mikania cordata]
MGQGTPGGFNRQGNSSERKNDGDKKDKKFKPGITTGKASARLPTVTPHSKCRLRLLKERLKPQEEKTEEDRSKVDDLRGSLMSFGNLEELIDENREACAMRWGRSYGRCGRRWGRRRKKRRWGRRRRKKPTVVGNEGGDGIPLFLPFRSIQTWFKV